MNDLASQIHPPPARASHPDEAEAPPHATPCAIHHRHRNYLQLRLQSLARKMLERRTPRALPGVEENAPYMYRNVRLEWIHGSTVCTWMTAVQKED